MDINEQREFVNEMLSRSFYETKDDLVDMPYVYESICSDYKAIEGDDRLKEAVGGILTAIEFVLGMNSDPRQ